KPLTFRAWLRRRYLAGEWGLYHKEEKPMRKCAYLDLRRGNGWPSPEELEPYFLRPPGQCWAFESGNDNAGLAAEGVDGTEDLDPNDGRIDVDLDMWGHPDLGARSFYPKGG